MKYDTTNALNRWLKCCSWQIVV